MLIANVLIINENGLDLSNIIENFKNNFCPIMIAESFETALRIIGNEHIDLIFLSINNPSYCYFSDFLSILKTVTGIVPLIAIINSSKQTDIFKWTNYDIDDIIPSNINYKNLLIRITPLLNVKNKILDPFAIKGYPDRKDNQNILIISKNNHKIFNNSFLKNLNITLSDTNLEIKNLNSFDLVLIDINTKNLCRLCAKIRLSNTNIPLLIIHTNKTKNLAVSILKKEIGITEIINEI